MAKRRRSKNLVINNDKRLEMNEPPLDSSLDQFPIFQRRRFSMRIACRRPFFSIDVDKPMTGQKRVKRSHLKTPHDSVERLPGVDKSPPGSSSSGSMIVQPMTIDQATSFSKIGQLTIEIDSMDLSDCDNLSNNNSEPKNTMEKNSILIHVSNLWHQPFIIQKILQNLSFRDIFRCGQVCKTWRKEATQRLKKYPIIDEFWYICKDMTYELEKLQCMGKIRDLKRLVSKGLLERLPILDSPYWRHWVYWPKWLICLRGNKVQASLKYSKVEKALKDFLGKDLKGIPICCLGRFSNLYIDDLHLISPKFPIVFLPNQYHFIPKVTMKKIYLGLDEIIKISEPLSSLADNGDEDDYENFDAVDDSPFLQSFLISRFTSEIHFKVIITNWNDQKSQMPDLNDSEFPVRALICFISSPKRSEAFEQTIEKFLKRVAFDVAVIPLEKEVLYHDSYFKGFRESPAISIAFAGKEVMSAIWEKKFDGDPPLGFPSLDTDEFMKSFIKFPLDDRVIGFVSGLYKGNSMWLDDAIMIIRDSLFPKIHVKLIFRLQSFVRKPYLRIHLVRV